eukprot:2226267-Pyramimonas_sp.AAC.1
MDFDQFVSCVLKRHCSSLFWPTVSKARCTTVWFAPVGITATTLAFVVIRSVLRVPLHSSRCVSRADESRTSSSLSAISSEETWVQPK